MRQATWTTICDGCGKPIDDEQADGVIVGLVLDGDVFDFHDSDHLRMFGDLLVELKRERVKKSIADAAAADVAAEVAVV